MAPFPLRFTVFVVFVALTTSAQECAVSSNGTTTYCTGTRMMTVPPLNVLSNATRVLILARNFFTVIPTAQLAAAPNLEILDLKSTYLTIITNDSFSTTPNLRDLNLDGNIFLQEIDVGGFNHLTRLTKLSMAATGLTTLVRNHFAPLTSLQILNFAFNPIAKAPLDLFAALTSATDIKIAACVDISTALATHDLGLTNITRLDKLYVSAFRGCHGQKVVTRRYDST